MKKTILFSFLLISQAVAEPLEWVVRQLPVDLVGAAWDGHQFVVVSERGHVITSADGSNWRPHECSLTPVTGLAAGNGSLVVVGPDGRAGQSKDGVGWRSLQLHSGAQSIAFGKGRFVSVGGTQVSTSEDGLHWKQQKAPAALQSVVFQDGLWLARGKQSWSSEDGLAWKKAPAAKVQELPKGARSLAFSGSSYVAVGKGGLLLTSSDGSRWQPGLSKVAHSWTQVAYLNGRMLAVGQAGMATSADGLNWQDCGPKVGSWLNGCAYGNGTYVVAGEGGLLLTSSDLSVWNGQPNWKYPGFGAVGFGAGRFVAAGRVQRGAGELYVTSSDGRSWTEAQETKLEKVRRLVYAHGLWLGCCSEGPPEKIVTSGDGQHWTSHLCAKPDKYDQTAAIHDAVWAHDRYIAVGDAEGPENSFAIFTSPDGSQWTAAPRPADGQRSSFAGLAVADDGLVVAVGPDSQVGQSTDGLHWQLDKPYNNPLAEGPFQMQVNWMLLSVTYAKGRFVAVGNAGEILTAEH